MRNRLAESASLYLRQHANHPVAWLPWGEEAFARAEAEDKPILISIGYSSCHWCHVMAHECFEDEDVAAVLNEYFVSIKVDREERPDVDDAYMTAVQLSTGRGGWPITIFATPDRKPFFAGTYIPKLDRGGQPGFLAICRQIAAAWSQSRSQIQAAADDFALALNEAIVAEVPAELDRLTAADIEDAVRALAADFDEEHGGFGSAPKFPPHSSIDFLLAFAESEFGDSSLRNDADRMARMTLQAILRGGIHDHVGGGYHRYSTDREWHLPHFEKMLYDNALLIRNMFRAGLDIQRDVEWLVREMRGDDGLFYAAIDADSPGGEGAYYTWSVAALRTVLGEATEHVIDEFGVSLGGNFFDEATRNSTGENVLDYRTGQSNAMISNELLDQLLAARAERIPPSVDQKAVVAWNGLAILALAESGHVDLAQTAADRILSFHPLPHMIVEGRGDGEAFLDDYAYLCRGCLALFQATGNQKWRESAIELLEVAHREFYDEASGAYFSTSPKHEFLFGRHKPIFDNPVPSANAVMIECFAILGSLGEAQRTIDALMGWMHRAPHATEALHRAAMYLVAPESGVQVVASTATASAFKTVDVSVEVEYDADERSGAVIFEIPEGWYIDGPSVPPARPNEVEIIATGASIMISWPISYRYTGRTEIRFSVFSTESNLFELRVGYQACTHEMCLLPMERTFDVRVEK